MHDGASVWPMAVALVLAGLVLASASVACVALLYARDHARARVLGGAGALVALAAWLLLTRGGLDDATRLREVTYLTVAGGAPGIATLLLAGVPSRTRRVLALAVAAFGVPMQVVGIAYLGREALGMDPWGMVLPVLLSLHLIATVAAGMRAFAPTSPSP